MSCQLVKVTIPGHEATYGALRCDTDGHMFGPLFDDIDAAYDFAIWVYRTHNRDPRSYDYKALVQVKREWEAKKVEGVA